MTDNANVNDAAAEAVAPNPFDPEKLALRGNPADEIGAKRALVNVPVRKPNKQEFLRAHPDDKFRVPMAILNLEAEDEIYAVIPDVALTIPGDTRLVMLTTCVNRQGNVFLWPVPLPVEGGRENTWNLTSREGAARAEKAWVRLVSNRGAGAYDIWEAQTQIAEPQWPERPFKDLLAIAFGNGRLIDREDHPVLQQLLGQA